MANISTLSELLLLSNCQYRIYDLGRKIDKISKEQFNKIEANQLPYPFPSQGHAFIAVAFWQKRSSEPYLWFIKLPLDERGLLSQAATNHFIGIIVDALGADLSVNPTEQQEELLKSNPYHFTPPQYKLAAINSLLKRELKQPASIHFEHCQAYFSGQISWHEWQSVGLQGIADFAERINDDDNTQYLIKALPNLPLEVLSPLCGALENQKLHVELIEQLINAYQKSPNALYLRALASNCQHPNVVAFIESLLNSSLNNSLFNNRQSQATHLTEDELITLAGRCWLIFTEKTRLLSYLECIVSKENKALFPAIFKDLVAIPTIRPVLFQCMREPNRSADLAKAIGLLFNQAK